MIEFFRQLFDTSDFPPRWHCGNWTSGHGWLHVLSDLGVWSAYVAIPCVLVYLISRRRDLPFQKIFWLFGAFILACGTTHLMEAIIFWWPAYRLAGLIKLATALVSWGTVVALAQVFPLALTLRSPQELEREVVERRKAEAALLHIKNDLENHVAARTAELNQANESLKAEIAQRQLAQEQLANEREWLRVTLASIGDAVIVTDIHGCINSFNRVAADLTGWSDTVYGRPLIENFKIINEKTGQPAVDPVARVLATGKIEGLANHTVLVAADGTGHPIDDSAAPITNELGTMLGVVLVFRDVSERKRGEALVQRSEERYRALLEATTQTVWTTDPSGQVVDDSPSWRAFTGQTSDERKGWGWLEALHPDDRERIAQVWRSAVATQEVCQFEYRLRGTDGGYRHMLVRAVPMHDEEGRIIEWVGMNTDVTEQRHAEAALRESDKRKDDFLAMLGHELRNPLAGITGAVEVLATAENTDPDAVEMCGIIERQSRHMCRMIDDLLDVSRIARGKLQLRLARFDLVELVRRTVEDSRLPLEAKGLQLHLVLPEHPVEVNGDSTRLAQVVFNLLQNSGKFTHSGGRVTVEVEQAQPRSALVHVHDTGIGIDSATVHRVFEPFTQGEHPLEKNSDGLGLGLALVKGLVELHGGQVSAASAGHGQGSHFTVRLPVAVEPAAPAAADDGDTPPQPSCRILIIDDSRDASYPLQKLLTRLGHEVFVADDALKGLELAQQCQPELVLCDIGLPGELNGYDVARTLKRDPLIGRALLVAVTGFGQDEDRRRAAEAGFDQHLTKPVSMAALKTLIAGLQPPLGTVS